MNALKICVRRAGAVLSCMALVAVLGCGDDINVGKRYPVSGTVTYNGKPVEKGRVQFDPAKGDGRAAHGEIKNGSYSLSTVGENDGALPGNYRVSIISQEVDMTQVLAKAGGGAGHQDDIGKAGAKAKILVPSKYSIPDTSGLTAVVPEKATTVDFPLTD